MPNEKPIKRVTRKPVKVSRLEEKPLPPIDVGESLKIVLEALQYDKAGGSDDGPVVDVSTGHKF